MVISETKQKLTAAMAESGYSCAASEQYLLERYGATMSLGDLAVELRTTANALRIRQLRFGDLPPSIPGVRGYLWPTVVIAGWISGLTGSSHPHTQVRALQPPASGIKRRGRPRKCRPPEARSGVPTP